MQISKNSWHYRFNNYIQDGFASRVRHDTFTTCTYIRTTIASAFTGLFKLLFILLLGAVAVALVCSGVYVPFALAFTLPLTESITFFGIIFWGFTFTSMFIAACIYGLTIKERLADRLADRREKKLNLLRQAMADQKAGICTIVEFKD